MTRNSFQSKGRREYGINVENFQNKNERIFKCRKCDGFGHYQVEYPNFVR